MLVGAGLFAADELRTKGEPEEAVEMVDGEAEQLRRLSI